MSTTTTTEFVWSEIRKRNFAVLSYVNPKGEARSAGIIYVAKDKKLYINTSTDSWKIRHIRGNPNVALNVTIPKRVPFMPWIKIPQATIAFSGKASVVEAATVERDILKGMLHGLADDPQMISTMSIIEVTPIGHFATYGVGVSLLDMRDPKKARTRVAVG